MWSLLIKNGLVVTHQTTMAADIAVQGEKIAAIGSWGSLGEARTVLDARGMLVLPGLIDPHVHIKHPCKGGMTPGDFYDASKTAASGGNTTLIDFAIQWDKEKTLAETVSWRRGDADPDVAIDYAVHACPTRSTMETVEAFAGLIQSGIPSLKLYMTYSTQGRMADDGVLLRALEEAGKHGGIVGVHAENDAMCIFNEAECKARGWTHPRYFPLCKGNIVEAEAVNRAVYLNRHVGGNLYIFHLSTAESLQIVAEAQGRGEHVVAETCTHYLTLDESALQGDDGCQFICSPPLRSKRDVEALWKGIANGTITIVSSDHCGYTKAQKALGNGNFMQTPNGLPSMELRLSLMYTEGVLKKRISLEQMVGLLTTNAAKTFGMFPQKGCLAPGSDADIVLVDTREEKTVEAGTVFSNADYTPFAGKKLRGFVRVAVSRGEVILENGVFSAARGRGRFVQRSLNNDAAPVEGLCPANAPAGKPSGM